MPYSAPEAGEGYKTTAYFSPTIRERIIEDHMGLAKSVARGFLSSGEPLEDLDAVAYEGLVNAVDRFDPGRGLEFSTFAVPTIRGAIRRYLRDSHPSMVIGIPRRVYEAGVEVKKVCTAFHGEYGREPTEEEVLNRLGSGVKRDHALNYMANRELFHVLSTDNLVAREDSEGGQSSAARSADFAADEQAGEAYGRVDDMLMMGQILKALSPVERSVVNGIYAEGLSQKDVAERVGYSEMHVYSLHRRALGKMREVCGVMAAET